MQLRIYTRTEYVLGVIKNELLVGLLKKGELVCIMQKSVYNIRFGDWNRFQEPSLELCSQATLPGGPVPQPYAYASICFKIFSHSLPNI
jgi:hypothetical protein